MIKDFDLTISIRNNRLKQRRIEAGYKTGASFCRAAGVSPVVYSQLERMVISPINKGQGRSRYGVGEWRPVVVLIADFLKVNPFDLFPNAVHEIKTNEISVKINESDIRDLYSLSGRVLPLLPDDAIGRSELIDMIKHHFEKLTPMEQLIIRWSFGLEGEDELTLDQIGDKFNLSGERIRQIREEGLSKIRRMTLENNAIDTP